MTSGTAGHAYSAPGRKSCVIGAMNLHRYPSGRSFEDPGVTVAPQRTRPIPEDARLVDPQRRDPVPGLRRNEQDEAAPHVLETDHFRMSSTTGTAVWGGFCGSVMASAVGETPHSVARSFCHSSRPRRATSDPSWSN